MSTGLIVVGTNAGGVTQNPILLGVISGSGLLLKTYIEIKKFSGRRSNYAALLPQVMKKFPWI